MCALFVRTYLPTLSPDLIEDSRKEISASPSLVGVADDLEEIDESFDIQNIVTSTLYLHGRLFRTVGLKYRCLGQAGWLCSRP